MIAKLTDTIPKCHLISIGELAIRLWNQLQKFYYVSIIGKILVLQNPIRYMAEKSTTTTVMNVICKSHELLFVHHCELLFIFNPFLALTGPNFKKLDHRCDLISRHLGLEIIVVMHSQLAVLRRLRINIEEVEKLKYLT